MNTSSRIAGVLRPLHRLIGLLLCAPLVLIAASGAALVFVEDMRVWRLPALASTSLPHSPAEVGRDLDTVDRLSAPIGWNLVRLPEPDRRYYEVWLMSDERAFLLPGANAFIDRFGALERPETFIYEIHAHLLAGETGELVVAWIGVVVLSLLFSGSFLAWPPGRSVRGKWLLLTSRSRPGDWLRAHIAWMVIAAPLLFVSVATGVLTAFPKETKAVLAAIAGGERPAVEIPEVAFPEESPNWAAVIGTAGGALADDHLIYLFKPAPGDEGAIAFRARRSGEWHPNGRSEIYVEAGTGRLLGAADATEFGLGLRVADSIFPVHAAQGSARVLAPLVFAAGIVMTAAVIFAASARVLRRKKRGAQDEPVRR